MKRRFKDPYIVIAGDLNQWKVDDVLADFSDILEVKDGCTRKERAVDRIFLNVSRSVTGYGMLQPLQAEESDVLSDHKVAYCWTKLKKKQSFVWEKYTYRYYSKEKAKKFKEWAVLHEWNEIKQADGSVAKAEAYQATIEAALDRYFPLKTTKRKSTDCPWLNGKTRRAIKDRKALFIEEGGVRTDKWKEDKKKTTAMVCERKRAYMDNQRGHILAKDSNRNFYKHVKNFNKLEKPPIFEVRSLLPDKSDNDVAEELAEFFIRVSREFDPLTQDQIPTTYLVGLPILRKYEVASRIRRFRKPESRVPGDIFPDLVTELADILAIPLTSIYNEITRTRTWPKCLKKEYVTVIMKNSSPQSLNDLGNISCTMLASKMYESYVLDWLKTEVKLKDNQYGGRKGIGTDHVLVQLWQEILENLDDYRAGTVVTSIDYSKAFNRMSYQECLAALAAKGASSEVLQLVATFLRDRYMVVKTGDALSDPREVFGGCPQGSILGVFLFNATIDNLEDGCEDLRASEEAEKEVVTFSPPRPAPHSNRPPHIVPSTPRADRPPLQETPAESPILRPKRAGRTRRLDISAELCVTVPPEPNDRTEAKWKEKKGGILEIH